MFSGIIIDMNALHLARPHAIMMVGIPGSGKSFFARQFSDMFRTPYLDIAEILEYIGDDAKTEKIVLYLLNEITKTEQTFLFEGNSASRTSRTEFAKWARTKGYQPLFIWIQTDQATSKSRTLRAKTLTRDQFDNQIHQFSAPHIDEKAVVVSGRHTYATQARVVLNHLGKQNREHTAAAAVPTPVAPVPRNVAPVASQTVNRPITRNISVQ